MGDLEKFAEFLYGNRSGYVYVPVKKRDLSWVTNFFNWPLQRQQMYDFIRTSSAEDDVYISPSLFSDKSGKKAGVKNAGVAWVEFDGKKEISFKGLPEPDCIVQSSTADHLHCYWGLDQPLNASAVEDINRRLTYYLEADSSGWDANQVLRPPETNNWKLDKERPVVLKKLQPKKHLTDAFDKAPEVVVPVKTTQYEDIVDATTIEIPEALNDRIFKQVSVHGARSSFLMQTGYLLAESGFSHIEIVSLLYVVDCRIKKFVGRHDQLVRLNEIASLALMKVEGPSTESYSPFEVINNELSMEWYIEGWLHSEGLMLVTGAPGVGKTQFSLDLAYRLATGDSVLGKPKVSPKTVAFLSLEMDILELKYIFEHQAREFKATELWDKNTKVFVYDEGTFKAYEKTIKDNKPDVIVIDSLSELATEDLKEGEAREIMRWFKRMRRTYGCAIIVIHHNRKASDANKKPRKLSDLYGSFIFAKLSETVISLWQDEGKDYLELDTLKTRFGKSERIRLTRSKNLVFNSSELSEVSVRGNPLVSAQTEQLSKMRFNA
jgi:archaellum biogenesis ATPase FlaH